MNRRERATFVETTGGSLYSYERSLYLTLTEYRQRAERTESNNLADRRLFNPTGLANRTVHFVPESAKRPDSYRTARSTDTTLVIDYNLLATMPAASGMRSTAAQPADACEGGIRSARYRSGRSYGKNCRRSKRNWQSKRRNGHVRALRPPRSRRLDRFLSKMLKKSLFSPARPEGCRDSLSTRGHSFHQAAFSHRSEAQRTEASAFASSLTVAFTLPIDQTHFVL